MRTFVLIAICLIGAIAVEDGMETIQKLESSSFGKNMLDTIQL
jgi:hypothetical protein